MPKEKQAPPAEMLTPEPRLSKFQAFRIERLARRELKGAPYNPRVISPHAAKRLRESLRANGLVETIIWNRRTGNLVGGHQRLSQLDALEKSPDYSLDVAVIEVDEKQEREINVALNNPSMQGAYSVEALEQMLGSFDLDKAGFGEVDIQAMFPEWAQAQSMFNIEEQSPEAQKTVLDLEELAELKRKKREGKKAAKDADDTEFHCLVVFRNREERERCMELLGLDREERYISGDVLLSLFEDAAS